MLSDFDPISLTVFAALGILSVAAITVCLFKTIQFRRLGVGATERADGILDAWLGGRPDEAMRAASERDSVGARVLQAVLSALRARPNDAAYAEELGRTAALREMGLLERRMRVLEAVVQGAPMLGLLGTVVGMIDAFSTLAAGAGAVDPTLLASGIWTALTTTAAGLAIALVTFFIATWLESRIEAERQLLESAISAAIHGRVEAGAAV
ncbi:MotA/TolQ/ExbB proton channel family protein [Jannaschia aquimarina]|uniref:Colicin uptake protein TolQ n=1 Tax=Jannaschia aquimarina TaxID=935700 RepID=A0A0D1EQK7_9RHOB|nr:MotA/TolQ/ExbB proton channel family protein [Jannaschia aquimarina]KIT17910.1 colicin uptake protein TolQ [Jannaschia aquimarina]SNT23588.1 biopolymer transport protein ExbB [Jannaschia aquimarina]